MNKQTIEQDITTEQKSLSKIIKYFTLPLYKKVFYYLFLNKEDKKNLKIFKQKQKLDKQLDKKEYDRNNIFEIRNLNLYYDKSKQALYDINLNIQRNKVTAFIGPSGCGKTTLLKCLNRINDLNHNILMTGNIYFDNGTNIYNKNFSTIELTTRVGMIFQKYAPFNMTIYDNVAYGPRSHGITDKKILDKIVKDALIDAALWDEIKDKLSAFGTSLSGGQQQRLCIARAIAIKPEVLLMDEPTSGLDPIATSKIEDLIIKLKQKYTIILVTHSMTQAQRVSDNVAFFYKGHLVETNTTKKLFTNPKHTKTKNYILGRR